MRLVLIVAVSTVAGLGACAPLAPDGAPYGYGYSGAQPVQAAPYGYYDGGYAAPGPYYQQPGYAAPSLRGRRSSWAASDGSMSAIGIATIGPRTSGVTGARRTSRSPAVTTVVSLAANMAASLAGNILVVPDPGLGPRKWQRRVRTRSRRARCSRHPGRAVMRRTSIPPIQAHRVAPIDSRSGRHHRNSV